MDRLRSIKRLDQLIAYLRDELDWPIDSDDVEDISFSYEPEELGLAPEHAARINQIKQIRPLHSGQPWGIFWISFEKKKLPVVVLRRILASLVVKSRQSANSADRPRWKLNDLLFISAYGDEATDQREIAFAHFSQSEGDLPTLKVLGWDGADTPLKLNYVASTLAEKLRWPAQPADADAWRTQWASAFRHRLGHVIRTSDLLAERLAALARNIRDAAAKLLEAESERGPLTKLYKAFQAALIHDLTPESFADTYAQTITYGLFTAAVNRTEMSGGAAGTFVKADDVALMARVTSPFLKEMLETFLHVGGRKNGVDFDELGIQDVVELLRGEETDLPAILRDFGNRTRGEDPVIHFYEHFLSAYNKKLKVQRGVFYTPQPVVSYIVRSVHELLQTEFGLEDGLASTVTWGEMLKKNPGLKLPPLTDEPGESRTISPDEPFVQILDPATGTATFLVEVIDVIYKHLKAKWDQGGLATMPPVAVAAAPLAPLRGAALSVTGSGGVAGAQPPANVSQPSGLPPRTFADYWNLYVPQHLLPRLHGYELLAAPYAIAHLKLGLKLTETGYRFGSDERARVFLTNALEPWVKQMPLIGFEPLAHEAQAVNDIKRYKRFTVVIGNPPYAGVSSNNSEHAVRLVDAYKVVDGEALGEKKLWLQDDYVKFIRHCQMRLDETGVGLLGFITNHGFLDNPTFRGMRQSLMRSFPCLRLLDLHGNANKGEQAPDGSEDQNVFEIRQGVGITLAAAPIQRAAITVDHFQIWGLRSEKYKWLGTHSIRSTNWARVTPSAPYRFFVPRNQNTQAEYDQLYPVEKVVRDRTVGMITARDSLTIHFTRADIIETVKRFASLPPEAAREEFELGKDARDWSVERAQEDLRAHKLSERCLRTVLYRPFDMRHTFYTGTSRGFIGQPQKRIISHLDGKRNWALCISRFNRQKSLGYFFATRILTDFHLLDTVADSMTVFPLFLSGESDQQDALSLSEGETPNFSAEFLSAVSRALGISKRQVSGLPAGVTPEDIFHYIYAVFYSPTYRKRYADFLKIDFPRVPLTGSMELFRALAGLGGELVALHLMESPKLDHLITEYVGGRAPVVEKVSWSKNTVWLDKAQSTGFRGVPENVWNFHIGGYQVCEKWLKDRKGRTLTADDLTHYQKIVVALAETIRLMGEIDAVIEKHGGWPLK